MPSETIVAFRWPVPDRSHSRYSLAAAPSKGRGAFRFRCDAFVNFTRRYPRDHDRIADGIGWALLAFIVEEITHGFRHSRENNITWPGSKALISDAASMAGFEPKPMHYEIDNTFV